MVPENLNLTECVDTQFLAMLREEKIKVGVYLVSGIKLEGLILNFDIKCIALSHNSSKIMQLVYKHAISTIVRLDKLEAKYD